MTTRTALQNTLYPSACPDSAGVPEASSFVASKTRGMVLGRPFVGALHA
ncbi:MAG: hypothetical protein O3A25_14505 [Acidobacteria bacterium]|nr:hypothetical protein [Acidobacteriota bacterium]